MSVFRPGVRVHVVGVGGAGMSGMAMLLSEYGAVVSGSDAASSTIFDDLRARHVTTFEGHDARSVEGAEVVLWSPAVSFDNVELVAARENGGRAWYRERARSKNSPPSSASSGSRAPTARPPPPR